MKTTGKVFIAVGKHHRRRGHRLGDEGPGIIDKVVVRAPLVTYEINKAGESPGAIARQIAGSLTSKASLAAFGAGSIMTGTGGLHR